MTKAAIIQMCSSTDMQRNLKDAIDLVRDAAAKGATYIQTPEVTNIFEPDKERLKAVAMTVDKDIFVAAFAGLAKELGVHLHAGSLALNAGREKLANRSFLFAPDGHVQATYDKIHLFDIDLPTGESHRESATYNPGEAAVVAKLPDFNLGFAICYDMRFPRLANALATAGANVLTYPAAFTVPTGQAHWHVLLRCRAIETGSFVFAAAQGGTHDSGRATYGHSIAISPWGEVLAEAGTEPAVLLVEFDAALSAATRARIPTLVHARDFALKQAGSIAT
jgi:deaminated glutathione amidase